MAMFDRDALLGDWHNPIPVDDDDDHPSAIAAHTQRLEEERQTGQRLVQWATSVNTGLSTPDRSERSSPATVRDFDREEIIEDVLEANIAELVDLTGDDEPLPSFAEPATPRDNLQSRTLSSYRLPNGSRIRIGTAVELRRPLGPYNVQFLKVRSIVRPRETSEVLVRGWAFTRTRELDGMLPRKRNELAMMVELRDQRPWEEATIEVRVSNLLRIRELIITNTPFPENRFDLGLVGAMGEKWVEGNARLVCRYRFTVYHHGNCPKPFEWALVRITETEADAAYRMADSHNLSRWRGGKIPGGSHIPNSVNYNVIDLDAPASVPAAAPAPSRGQQYTAGDVFAGAGGASRGIERAGVKLLFAVDHWDPAAQTLRKNFPHAHIYNNEVSDFISDPDVEGPVDILHLSPPCQYWSPAHTVAGRNDDANKDVLLACTDLIDKIRPRLFTVEQTYGILFDRFRCYVNTFINGFTYHGYSVRWKVLNLANYGVPQTRRRLVMIGSAPGEALPPMPPITHSKHGGAAGNNFRPWTTPQSALSVITPDFVHEHHNPHTKKRFDPPRRPWDPTKLAKTITTTGGVGNYHWSGTRDFTLLEYAVLQGFPMWHRFERPHVKKQIGNAFAPSVVRVLYKHLVDWLLVQDGFQSRAAAVGTVTAGDGVVPEEVVCLSDDDDMEEVIVDNGGMEREEEEEEVVFVGSRSRSQRLSEVVRRLNLAALVQGDIGEPMVLDGVDELSDTETLQDVEVVLARDQRMDVDEEIWVV